MSLPVGNMIMINKHIVGVKTNYSTKEIGWGFLFEKGGAHAPVAPPLATALLPLLDILYLAGFTM